MSWSLPDLEEHTYVAGMSSALRGAMIGSGVREERRQGGRGYGHSSLPSHQTPKLIQGGRREGIKERTK